MTYATQGGRTQERQQMNDYEVITTSDGKTPLDREHVSGLNGFKFVSGLCAADELNPNRRQPRSRKWYITNVLPGINDGSEQGTRDNRKLRIHNLSLDDGVLTVAQGISHYGEFREELVNSDGTNLQLQECGKSRYGDRFAYLSRIAGVGALVFSKEGSVYVGRRAPETDAPGLLDCVSGHRAYQEDPTVDTFRADLEDALLRKRGVPAEAITGTEFVGAFGHKARGDFDFTWFVRTDLPDSHFEEHAGGDLQTGVVKLVSYDQAREVLEHGTTLGLEGVHEFHYTLRGLLEQLRPEDFGK